MFLFLIALQHLSQLISSEQYTMSQQGDTCVHVFATYRPIFEKYFPSKFEVKQLLKVSPYESQTQSAQATERTMATVDDTSM